MSERTLVTSAAALAAVGLLSLLLAYRQSTAVPVVSEPVDGTVAVGSEGATTTEAEPTTSGQQCQQAAYLAYSPTNITDETLAPVTASNELCIPISALSPDETIVGAFLNQDDACAYRDQHPGTSIRGLQLPVDPDPCG